MLNINILTPCWFGRGVIQNAIANTPTEMGIASTCSIVGEKIIKMAEPLKHFKVLSV